MLLHNIDAMMQAISETFHDGFYSQNDSCVDQGNEGAGLFHSFSWLSNIPSWASQVMLVVKNSPANAGDVREAGSIPGLGRSPGGGNDTPFQCIQ